MKSLGIVRPIDHLGRVVIPAELRGTMSIVERNPLEIFVDDNKIVFKKYLPGCVFCGNAERLKNIKGKYVCEVCLEEIKEKFFK